MQELELYHFLGIITIIFIDKIRLKLIETQNRFLVFLGYSFSVTWHELMHFIFALITFAKPINFSIFPKKYHYIDKKRYERIYWTLGSVEATNVNFINAPFVGLAPLFLLVIAYYVYKYYFYYFSLTLHNIIVFYIILYMLISNSIPSMQDIRVAFGKFYYTIIFYFVVVYVYLMYIKHYVENM